LIRLSAMGLPILPTPIKASSGLLFMISQNAETAVIPEKMADSQNQKI